MGFRILRLCTLLGLLLANSVCAQSGLTESGVRQAIATMDAATQRRDASGVLDFIDDDAVMAVQVDGPDGKRMVQLDKAEYGNQLAQMFAVMQKYDLRRDQLRIDVAPDGQSARVSEVQYETVTIGGKTLSSTTRSISEIRLVGGKPRIVRAQAQAVDRP